MIDITFAVIDGNSLATKKIDDKTLHTIKILSSINLQ